jgi:hypothetical protein
VRGIAAITLVGTVPALLGGVVFWAAHSQTPLSRSIAYGFWFAAAACLVLMLVTGNKRVWRALPIAAYEGWVFTGAAVVLTAVGAVVDTLGM